MRLTGLSLTLILAAFVAGCSYMETKAPADNIKALRSTIEAPARGAAEDRLYVNSATRGNVYAGIKVLAPRLIEPVGSYVAETDYRDFISQLGPTFQEALRMVLKDSDKLGAPRAVLDDGTLAPDGPVELELSSEVLVHAYPPALAYLPRDPVFNDQRQKLIAVFSIREIVSGRLVAKYTTWGLSQWEYGKWAMEDLLNQAVEISVELGSALEGL